VEFRFSLADQWSRHLLVALLRRYGIKPYRYSRQRRTTVMVIPVSVASSPRGATSSVVDKHRMCREHDPRIGLIDDVVVLVFVVQCVQNAADGAETGPPLLV
jgi:hypothetical protein